MTGKEQRQSWAEAVMCRIGLRYGAERVTSPMTLLLWYAVPLLVMTVSGAPQAQAPRPSPRPVPRVVSPEGQRLFVAVADENGVAVSSARVFLRSSPTTPSLLRETDFAGHCYFQGLGAGTYELRVEKAGFYALSSHVQVGQTSSIDVELSHLQEVHAVVNVVESPPGIDPGQTESAEQLTGMDVLNIPYPATHDYRKVLNFIPGVVLDTSGQPHILGAETYQTLTLLDGFNITQPANGLLLVRISTDAIRSLNVESSRISVEKGKGSGGVLGINTGTGDDHYRFAATNFLPSFQFKKGFAFDNVVPRVTISGPIRKGKIWFFEGADGEYDNIIVPELPNGSDSDKLWRIGNIAKLQMNLAPGHILTASYLINRQHDEHFGLSTFSPPASTPSDTESGDFAMVKDQIYLPSGQLLDFGFHFDQYVSQLAPQGSQSYIANGQATAQGSYYLAAHTRALRWQGLTNLSFAPRQWHGRHEFKVGIDLDRLAYLPTFHRNPISYLRVGQTLPAAGTCLSVTPSPCSRYSVFEIGPEGEKHNGELGSYAQDRWSPTDRLLIEAGLRFDWDEIVRHSLLSPRVATTYVLDNEGTTKLSAGIGIFYDASNMVLISRPFEGQRLDYFFDGNGNPIPGANCAPSAAVLPCPVLMTFTVNQSSLQAPRFLNWSIALERKLPAAIYLKAEFIQRHGTGGFVYNTPPGSLPSNGGFILQNTRRDHYDSFQIGARKAFRKSYLVTGSYMHSAARSNQVLDFSVDNPIYSSQLAGPFLWDAPNRFLSTGIVPVSLPRLKKFDLEYSAEARSGFPFYVVNNQQQLAELPGSRRFPTYFSLNLFLEKRFEFRGRYWAIRGGFDNITGRRNPAAVNNDIDSPQFLTFAALSHRAFTARIRLLGRK